MVDFPAISRLALSHSESICYTLFSLGEKKGREFVIGDLYGNRGDSLSVNLESGVWKEFNGHAGGADIISLVAATKNISQSEAVEWIETNYGSAPVKKTKEKKEEFEPIYPVLEHAPESAFFHPTLGKAVCVFCYNNRDGELINYVCRFEPKSYRALTYGKLNGKEGWHWKQLPSPRFLYNIDLIPDVGSIIVVEGEKSAEALREKLPDQCVITWPAGAEAVGKTDWSPLFSKKYDILLWPDNDSAGQKAMQNVAYVLQGKVASIGILDVSDLPPKSDAADFNGSTGDIQNFILQKRKAIKFDDLMPAPRSMLSDKIDPLSMGGIIGDTVRWICKHAIFEQPELALLNTLAFAGSVFGRRWIGPTGTHTNIYTVGVVPTGLGKEHSCRMITTLAAHADLSKFIGGNSIRSDTGMIRGLSNNSSQILMLDEFGMWLQGVANKRAPHFIQEVIRTILSLYGKSSGVYNHGDYADAKAAPIVIYNPVLCIYGMSTESEYIPALKKSAIASGQMSRFITLPGRSSVKPRHNAPIVTMDESLLEQWKCFAPSSLGEMVNNSNVGPKPVVVEKGKCDRIIQALLEKQTEKATSKSDTAELWVRYWENSLRLAAILAVARNPDKPVHIPEDFEISSMLMEMSIDYIKSLAENNMAETEHESIYNEVLLYIRKQPMGISRTDLITRFRKLKKRDMDQLMDGMIEQEVIEVFIQDKGEGASGRKKTSYRAVSKFI